MPTLPFDGISPQVKETSWIAPNSWVIGRANLGSNVSVFFGAVVRGDINPIVVDDGSNLQEGALLHTSTGLGPCIVGKNVTVGHHAILHGCTIKNNCIIGMGAIVLDGAEVGENCIIGANSLITMNTRIPAGTMVFGSPAKVVRQLTQQEINGIKESAEHYQALCAEYRKVIR